MPSDIVWVAVAGAIATVLGTLGAALLTGRIQGRTLKMQLEASESQLARQLEHQRREAHITRLVEVRKTHLLPIREVLGAFSGASMTTQILLLRGASQDSKSGVQWDEQIDQVAIDIEDAPSKLFALTGQLGDQPLLDRIDAFLARLGPVGHGIGRVKYIREQDPVDTEELMVAINAVFPALVALREKGTSVNQRITELLTGD